MNNHTSTSKRMLFCEQVEDRPFENKLGGKPFGFQSESWPKSPNTGVPMTFLAYFTDEVRRSFLFMSRSWDENNDMHVETYDPAMGEISLVSVTIADLDAASSNAGPTLESVFSIEFEEQPDFMDSEFGPLPAENSKLGGTVAYIQEDVPFDEAHQFFLQLNSEDTGYKPLEWFVGAGILYVFIRADGSGTGTWQCS